jgi:hypothetical protein
MNLERNNSGVFFVDWRQTYVGHNTLPQFPVAICIRKISLLRICGESRVRNCRHCCPMAAVTGMSVQTSLRLSGVSHRQTDRRTGGQNEFHSRVIRLGKHWPHSVMLCCTVLTALRHYEIHCALLPVCTVATAVK